MKVILEVNNKAGCKFDEKKLELVVEETIESSGVDILFTKDVTVSIAFVSSYEIQKINREYRSKDSSTDILSFANYDKKDDISKEESSNIFLGDLIVCCEDIENYTKEEDIDFTEELVRVISHGTLHLIGFLHGDEMFTIQEMVVKNRK